MALSASLRLGVPLSVSLKVSKQVYFTGHRLTQISLKSPSGFAL